MNRYLFAENGFHGSRGDFYDRANSYIDVFDNGRPLARAEAEAMAEGFSGEPARDEHLQPASKRDIIVRMLHNLLGIAQRAGSSTDVLGYLDVSLALEPEMALDRLDRAMLRVQTGDPSGAKQDLKWLLDNQPHGVDLDRIADLYHSL